ncbi:MAG TPA: HAMP domain-containing sensor histidine kinase, partial [Terracidiphilus sp.]|nr:HAMP domain-containing sensor histidine kinase [Terracidiphilus sp.]
DPLTAVLNRGPGIRTQILLILAMSLITAGATLVSMMAIRGPLQNLFTQELSADLDRSLATFESMQAQHLAALDRENAVIADEPRLKALMTTSDERTIQDGGSEFWKVGGNDLFALADRDGNIKAAYLKGVSPDAVLRADLQRLLVLRKANFLVSSEGLFGCSVQPLYFGSRAEGSLLGYVISGFAIDRESVQELSGATDVKAVFRSGDRILAGSLSAADSSGLPAVIPATSTLAQPHTIFINGRRFFAVSHDLSPRSTAPLTLVEMESLDQEERAIRQIDRLVLLAGALALVLGTVLMLALSRFVTRPLEQLACGVRAFATGNSSHLLPYRGTREVRELSTAFARMRREILQANLALLESERLATIGRMAGSVSHDLRHYLAAIYANSEFLASGSVPAAERSEVLAEIRNAVDGTTEMLESLLMFGRTGTGLRRSRQLMTTLVERAFHLVRGHPDAAQVEFDLHSGEPTATEAFVDAKQIERAIYNLLLNACQAPRPDGTPARIAITLVAREQEIEIDVSDNGNGVPPGILATLFEPFVSEGKHKGSGLGLTLTQSIAVEHGGSVALVSSIPGETIFRMQIPRAAQVADSLVSTSEQMGER